MENDFQQQSDRQPAIYLPKGFDAALGLAAASLVLGVLSLSLSIFVIGAGAGLLGLIPAIIHLHKKRPLRALAWWGLALSVLGLLVGTGFGLFYAFSIHETYSELDKLTSDESNLILEKFIGAEAPDFTMTDIEGNEITLSSLKGRRVILNFWATWCPPCRMEIPYLIDLRKEVHPDELAIIGISNEDKQDLLEFAIDKNINYTIAIADDLPAPYNFISAIPTTFFIDRQGIIQDVMDGLHTFEELKEKALAPDYTTDSNESNLSAEPLKYQSL
jgi:peroxiredoxin